MNILVILELSFFGVAVLLTLAGFALKLDALHAFANWFFGATFAFFIAYIVTT